MPDTNDNSITAESLPVTDIDVNVDNAAPENDLEAATTARAGGSRTKRADAATKLQWSKRIDFRVSKLGLGRIQISSGTANPAEYKRRKGLVKQLITSQDLDILRALRDDRLSIDDLVEAHSSKSMDALRRRVVMGNPVVVTGHTDDPETFRIAGPKQIVGDRSSSLRTWDDVTHAAERILTLPLWRVLEGDTTWDDSNSKPSTRKRYRQSVRALRVRLALARLSTTELQRLAELPERIWTALEHVHRRGLTVAEAKALADSSCMPRRHKAKRRRNGQSRPYSMANRTAAAPESGPALRTSRLGRHALLGLRLLDHDAWRILTACDGRVPSQQMVVGLMRLDPNDQLKMRELAQMLPPDAPTVALEEPRVAHWKALSAAWNASDADWNHLRRAISAALSAAFGYTDHPLRLRLMRRIELREESGRVTTLDFETFERILTFVEEKYRPHFRTLLQTGLRLSEFVRLTPDHLSPASRLVRVPGTKNPSSATYISVHEDFWPDLLASVPCPIGGSGLYQVWSRACEKAGVVDARQHDLRHAFGQWSLEQDVKDHEVQHALRHSSGSMTARYRRLKHSAAASEGLARALREKRAKLESRTSRAEGEQAATESDETLT